MHMEFKQNESEALVPGGELVGGKLKEGGFGRRLPKRLSVLSRRGEFSVLEGGEI